MSTASVFLYFLHLHVFYTSTKIVFFCYWQKQNPYFVTNHGQELLFFVANQRQQAIVLLQISGNKPHH